MTKPLIVVAWPKDDYLSALGAAGATPHVVDPARDSVSSLLARGDGVLLTGGADVDPVHYGDDERHPTLSLEPARDAYEIELARSALAENVPVLAICRGVQLLNVAAGGTLYQDLPSQFPSAITHRVPEPSDSFVHTVSIEPGSRLSALVDHPEGGVISVNSRHHQAVKDVAPGFITVARADDGVIEAIEDPRQAFCVGVQWHPENFWRTGTFASLFEGFVAAAHEARARRPHRA